MRQSFAKSIALGGVTAALAVMIICLGGLIPGATYVCPMLCTLLLSFILHLCGGKISWAWYGAVAILSILLGLDKEAAAIFLCVGYYPILKPKLDKLPVALLWKVILFNAVISGMYWALIQLFGMERLAVEFQELGTIFLIVFLVLGNLTFILLDVVLKCLAKKF